MRVTFEWVRACPIANSIGCRMTGDVECGLSKPEPSLTPTNGKFISVGVSEMS